MPIVTDLKNTARSFLRNKIPVFSRVDEAKADLLRSRKRVAALEARFALIEAGRTARYPVDFRSQFGEDIWIWEALGGQTTGFFIELGAFDGYNFSVSYALEAMGWNGLLIEALPKRYAECRNRRPHSRVENAALGRRGSTGTATFVSVEDAHGGMLSYTEAETAHAKRVSNLKKETIEVRLTWMDELLKDHTGPIDAVSIDVEGAELDVLHGFDLAKYKPRVMLLEDNEAGRNPALANYMAAQSDYLFIGWLTVNRLYVRKDELAVLDRITNL